jgi:MATE family multidrug resistance protein
VVDPPRATDPAEGPTRELRRRFVTLSIPNILANLAVPMAGVVDTALLGHLPEIAPLAGVALATVIFDYVYWSFGFLRMGTTSLVAQATGAGDDAQSDRWLGRSVALGVFIGAVILVAHPLIEWAAFALLDGAPDVETAGKSYFRARIWGAPLALPVFAVTGWLLGRQRARAVLAVTVVGALTNVGLDLWFIVGLGWGATGAGAATALSQALMLMTGLGLIGGARLAAAWRSRPQWREGMGRLFSLGGDLMIRTFALLTAFALFTNFAAALGTETLAANAVLLKALAVAAWVIDGYAFAVEAMAGAAKGRGGREELWALLRMAMAWGVGTGLGFAAVFVAIPDTLSILTDQPAVLEVAVGLRGWLAPTLAFSSAAYILDGYFIGLAAGRVLRTAMVWSLLLGFVPLALYARYGSGDVTHLWWAMVVFMVARVITLGAAVRVTLREA